MAKITNQKSKYTPWTDNGERLLLYADVMGFKSRVATRSHATLEKEINEFRSAWDAKTACLRLGDYLKFVQFSDSMLLVVQGIDSKMFNLLTQAAVCLMQTAMEKEFPIKGAIAQGDFSFSEDKQLYFGQPLVDASLLHDQLKYYGIAVHHSAEKTIKANTDILRPYTKTPIYIEKGIVKHYHLCWNTLNNGYKYEDITDKCSKWLDTIEETVSGEPRMYVDRTREVLKNDAAEMLKQKQQLEENKAN